MYVVYFESLKDDVNDNLPEYRIFIGVVADMICFSSFFDPAPINVDMSMNVTIKLFKR